MTPRIFGIDYAFLSCGSVFTDGLAHAASEDYAHARWDAPDLQWQIEAFAPDVLFVVHGRQFSRRFQSPKAFGALAAVWLLDEPYEVDDTEQWSSRFDHVFICDQATLHRHPRATYLPVCYDPHVHYSTDDIRPHAVGFIGGGNPTRERVLGALARAGLLTYVVGGDWGDPAVNARCLSRNIPPVTTAALYRGTRIVVNVFREVHHFNREGILATAMNPRIYEALACGALVVSEWRPEIEALVPELPTFRTAEDCVALVADVLAHPKQAEAIRATCAARLAGHTYAARLRTVLATIGAEVAA